MKIKSKIWLEKDGEIVIGSGKALILKAIDEEGSISRAAKKVNMSYRRAWSYIRIAEERLGSSLVIKLRGGKGGGGAVLTEYAKNLLKIFEELETEIIDYADVKFREIFSRS